MPDVDAGLRPLRQRPLEARLRVSLIEQEEHSIVFRVPYQPAQALVDRPDGAVKVPFLPAYGRNIGFLLLPHLFELPEVLLLLDQDGIADVREGNPNEDDCAAVMVWKVDALAGSSPADAIQDRSLLRSLLELLDVLLASSLLKDLRLDPAHPL